MIWPLTILACVAMLCGTLMFVIMYYFKKMDNLIEKEQTFWQIKHMHEEYPHGFELDDLEEEEY